MTVAQVILSIVDVLLTIYLLLLWARIALDLVQAFVRDWRPRGAMLVFAESVYTVTDPPVRFFRRVLPPMRVGPVALDFSVAVVMLAIILVLAILGAFLG